MEYIALSTKYIRKGNDAYYVPEHNISRKSVEECCFNFTWMVVGCVALKNLVEPFE